MLSYSGTASLGGNYVYEKLSEEIRFKAIPAYIWRQFVSRLDSTEFGKHQGTTLNFRKVGNISDYGRVIGEFDRVPEVDFASTTDTMTVSQVWNSVSWTEYLEDLAFLEISDMVHDRLTENVVKTLDYHVCTAFRTADLIYTPTGTEFSPSYTLATTGTCVTTSTRPFVMWDLKNIVDLLIGTYRVPFYDGNNFVGMFSTTAMRSIKDDPEYIMKAQYARPEELFTNEVGVINQVRCIHENHLLSNSYAGGLGEAIFFGADAVLEAEIEPVTFMAKLSTNWGRDKAIGYKWWGGHKKTWDYSTETEARIIRVASYA